MALCFVANKELTVAFSDVARRLRDRGEQIVWLSPSRRWTEWLLRAGWPAKDVLSMPDFAAEWRALSADDAARRLVDVEDEAPQTISNVIQMCRYLSRKGPSFAYPYLAVVRAHVEPFLRERKVEAAFGEGTWGFELMTWLICQRLGIPMTMPVHTRLPSDRFYFADSVSSDLIPFREVSDADCEWAEHFLTSWLNRPVSYMVSQQGYQSLQMRWVKEFAIAAFRPDLNRDDATLWPLWTRIWDRLRRIVNAKLLALFSPFERTLPKERYALYPLHHQPEASIDVFGSLNNNQVALIESLSRQLPATHKLWIKEHRGGISDRSILWFRRIKQLPNVRLIDPFANIFPLMRNADLLVTVSGTAGYEAALMGVPTLGLSPVFFASLMINRPTARSHPLEWRLRELLSRPPTEADRKENRRRSIEFLAYLHANSALGNPGDNMGDRPSRPDYMLSEADGIIAFVESLRRKGRPAG
jgi:hypothetical protein